MAEQPGVHSLSCRSGFSPTLDRLFCRAEARPTLSLGIFLWLLVALLLLSACSQAPDTGPGKVRWDREICARCGMAISDPLYSAQIRVHPKQGRSKLYKFDDIGCAVIWLDKKPFKNDPSVEIWVNDYHTKKWIDARKAWYVPGKVTPMGYGLGATTQKEQGAMNFAAARKHIYKVEETYHIHRGGQTHVHTQPQKGVP